MTTNLPLLIEYQPHHQQQLMVGVKGSKQSASARPSEGAAAEAAVSLLQRGPPSQLLGHSMSVLPKAAGKCRGQGIIQVLSTHHGEAPEHAWFAGVTLAQ